MSLDPTLLKMMIAAAAGRVIDSADELTALDQAIGDADHGVNMKRGCAEVLAQADAIAAKPTGEALKAIGMALVMKVGGASGPLYGSLFIAMGKRSASGRRQWRICPKCSPPASKPSAPAASRLRARRRCSTSSRPYSRRCRPAGRA